MEKYIYKCTRKNWTLCTGIYLYVYMYYWKERDVWKGKELKWLRGLERKGRREKEAE